MFEEAFGGAKSMVSPEATFGDEKQAHSDGWVRMTPVLQTRSKASIGMVGMTPLYKSSDILEA